MPVVSGVIANSHIVAASYGDGGLKLMMVSSSLWSKD